MQRGETDAMLATSEVAVMLGVSVPTVVRLCRSKELRHHRVGAHRRFALSDIVAFARERDMPLLLPEKWKVEPMVQRMRMEIDSKCFTAIESELAWRRTACLLYQQALSRFLEALARRQADGSVRIDKEARNELVAAARAVGVAEDAAAQSRLPFVRKAKEQ